MWELSDRDMAYGESSVGKELPLSCLAGRRNSFRASGLGGAVGERLISCQLCYSVLNILSKENVSGVELRER